MKFKRIEMILIVTLNQISMGKIQINMKNKVGRAIRKAIRKVIRTKNSIIMKKIHNITIKNQNNLTSLKTLLDSI